MMQIFLRFQLEGQSQALNIKLIKKTLSIQTSLDVNDCVNLFTLSLSWLLII